MAGPGQAADDYILSVDYQSHGMLRVGTRRIFVSPFTRQQVTPSVGVMALSTVCIDRQSASFVRIARDRGSCLILLKTGSIGFGSGL